MFETQGDRRAGTHLISPLEILYLTFVDHEKAGWKSIFESKDRIDNGYLVEFITNLELFMEEGKSFLKIYDQSSPILNYILLESNANLQMNINPELLSKVITKLVP